MKDPTYKKMLIWVVVQIVGMLWNKVLQVNQKF